MEFDLNKIADMLLLYAPKVVGALLTLVIGFWIIARITNLTQKAMERRGLDATIRPFLASIVNVGFKVLLLLSVAGMFGIETTSFVAIFSALAFAIGLALQGSLSHFASGVLLLVFRPYKVGDKIDIGGNVGDVEEIQVFNTVLRTLDNKRIIIPNGVVTSGVITNISGQGTIGVELSFSIDADEDIDKAKAVILQAIKACPLVLPNPEPSIAVGALAEDHTRLDTRPFCHSANYWDALHYLNEHVKKAMDQAGIQGPNKHLDVRVQQILQNGKPVM